VWSETVRQTKILKQSWSKKAPTQVRLDVTGITLAVIACAGFGTPFDWISSEEELANENPPGHSLSFHIAINETINHLIPILLYPKWLLRIIRPEVATAHDELDQYLRETIRMEEDNISANSQYESRKARGNLLTSVLRASRANADQAEVVLHGRKKTFTEDEVMGNLFVYLLGSYETTANAILYALIALALYPNIQNAVLEEIDAVHAAAVKAGREDINYEEDYHRLVYTFGFMVGLLPRMTKSFPLTRRSMRSFGYSQALSGSPR
jgi:cytochrome P450